MADHLITGTMTYVVIHCGNLSCQRVWEQPNTPLDGPGTNVCPHCLVGAPTNVAPRAGAGVAESLPRPSNYAERGPVVATARVVPPYLYELLWNIAIHGPLTAGELADDHNRPTTVRDYEKWTPQETVNRLRTPQRLGLVEHDADGFWLLTAAGRKWMTTGAEG